MGKIPWRRRQHPTPVFLPGKFHGQRSLVGFSLWGCKELYTTEYALPVKIQSPINDYWESRVFLRAPSSRRPYIQIFLAPSCIASHKICSVSQHPPPPAAAAAKSLQSCPTLCDPIDRSPPGSWPWDSPDKNTGVGCHFLLQYMKVKSESEVVQSCLTLSDPIDGSPPGSSIHGISRQEHWSEGSLPFLATSWEPINSSERAVLMSVGPVSLGTFIPSGTVIP